LYTIVKGEGEALCHIIIIPRKKESFERHVFGSFFLAEGMLPQPTKKTTQKNFTHTNIQEKTTRFKNKESGVNSFLTLTCTKYLLLSLSPLFSTVPPEWGGENFRKTHSA
jgi:hypothetical protein